MTNEQINTLVFKDQAGGYFLVQRETLEQGRVPVEHTAEIERRIAEQHDVQGHAVPVAIYGCALAGWLVMNIIGSGADDAIGQAIDWQSVGR